MQVSKNFTFWQHQKPASYIHLDVPTHPLHHFDMGEWVMVKRAVPYPDPSQHKLKREFARIFRVQREMVSLGCGSDELIERIPRIFLNPGDHVLVITPTFFRFIDATLRVGAVPVSVATRRQDDFLITHKVLEEVKEVIHKNEIKLIWISNPNTPTGVAVPSWFIQDVVQSSKDTLVVIDEAFKSIKETSGIKELSQLSNVIVLRSLSKLDGFAGLRIGCAIAHPHITKLLEDWRLPFNISKLSLDAALQQMKHNPRTSSSHSVLSHERKRIFLGIKELKHLELGATSKTNIFLLRHKEKDLFPLLLKSGILAADMQNALGLEGMRFVRLTIKSPKENNELLHVLKQINSSM